MYEGLASYFLPTGVLEYFEVTDFAEVPTQDTEVLYTTELHIYLDERDNRTPDMSGSVSDGFGEESCLLDFPTRDKKTVLHVRRRRWTMPDGTTKSVDLDKKIQLKHPGTRYSKDDSASAKHRQGAWHRRDFPARRVVHHCPQQGCPWSQGSNRRGCQGNKTCRCAESAHATS